MATVDDLKSIATAKLGFARPNQFLVELPPVPFLSKIKPLAKLFSSSILEFSICLFSESSMPQ